MDNGLHISASRKCRAERRQILEVTDQAQVIGLHKTLHNFIICKLIHPSAKGHNRMETFPKNNV